MRGMPNQVVDEQGAPAYAQTLANKLGQLRRVEMMGKKAATHQIERSLAKGQGERIGDKAGTGRSAIFTRTVAAGQVGWSAVEQGNIQGDSIPSEIAPNLFWDFSSSRSHFE